VQLASKLAKCTYKLCDRKKKSPKIKFGIKKREIHAGYESGENFEKFNT